MSIMDILTSLLAILQQPHQPGVAAKVTSARQEYPVTVAVMEIARQRLEQLLDGMDFELELPPEIVAILSMEEAVDLHFESRAVKENILSDCIDTEGWTYLVLECLPPNGVPKLARSSCVT